MMRGEKRIPELDGFRGIAVLGVLLYHLFAYSMFEGHRTGVASMAISATKEAWRGVDLFFVLSGFLITGILLDQRDDPNYFRNFYARRALRILPLYYVVLLIVLVGYPNSGRYFLLSFFFLSNAAPLFHIPMINGAMWSLSVEEHYYLVWPMVVRRMGTRSVAWVALGICALEPAIRYLAYPHVGAANIYVLSFFRLDGLASGALIACFVRSEWYSIRRAGLCAAGLAAAAIGLRIAGTPYGILRHDTPFGAGMEFVPVNVFFGAAVLYAVAHSGSAATAVLRNGFLRVTAELSYCLYLTHFLVINAYDAMLGVSPAVMAFSAIALRAAVVLVVCFALAALSRKALEGPVLRLKKFFTPATLRTRAAQGTGI